MAAMVVVVPSWIAEVAYGASPLVLEGDAPADANAVGSASSSDAPDVAKTEIRALLSGADAGSLSNPLRLQDAHSVAKICRTMENVPRSSRESDAYQRGAALAERASAKRRALSAVYEVTIPAGSFRVGDYRFAKKLLPLELTRGMRAVDESLILQVMDRRGGAFRLEPEEAKGVALKIARQQVSLRIVFRAAQDDGRACFAYPKSGASNLRIEPLSYALIDQASGGILARARTPALEALRAWVHPGQARFAIDVRGLDSANKAQASVRTALENARPALEGCVKEVVASEHETLVASFVVSVGRAKTPDSVRVVVENAEPEQESAVRCLQTALTKTTVSPAAGSVEAEVWVAVERGEDLLSPSDARESGE